MSVVPATGTVAAQGELVTRAVEQCDEQQVRAVLAKRVLEPLDFARLLSPAASGMLEEIARRARELTLRHFGSTVLLFTPLYISNYCENGCRYCSFACDRPIERRHLDAQGIEREARRIAATGMRHILVLTGESRRYAHPEYLCEAIGLLRRRFASISIEIYPLEVDEYRRLIDKGVDSLTLYQEVYDRDAYASLHPCGPKADYAWRFQAPARACQAGMHAVTLGPLLGLADWRREACALALHLRQLQRRWPGVEFAVSFPRMCPCGADFVVPHPVDDRSYVQLLCAFRVFAPTVGITMSTRESPRMRDHCAGICVTKMSAGVSTRVGGEASAQAQFEISDTRSLPEICSMLQDRGLQPLLHDWHSLLHRGGGG